MAPCRTYRGRGELACWRWRPYEAEGEQAESGSGWELAGWSWQPRGVGRAWLHAGWTEAEGSWLAGDGGRTRLRGSRPRPTRLGPRLRWSQAAVGSCAWLHVEEESLGSKNTHMATQNICMAKEKRPRVEADGFLTLFLCDVAEARAEGVGRGPSWGQSWKKTRRGGDGAGQRFEFGLREARRSHPWTWDKGRRWGRLRGSSGETWSRPDCSEDGAGRVEAREQLEAVRLSRRWSRPRGSSRAAWRQSDCPEDGVGRGDLGSSLEAALLPRGWSWPRGSSRAAWRRHDCPKDGADQGGARVQLGGGLTAQRMEPTEGELGSNLEVA